MKLLKYRIAVCFIYWGIKLLPEIKMKKILEKNIIDFAGRINILRSLGYANSDLLEYLLNEAKVARDE